MAYGREGPRADQYNNANIKGDYGFQIAFLSSPPCILFSPPPTLKHFGTAASASRLDARGCFPHQAN